MLTTLFQIINTLLFVAIFIGIPYLIYSLIKRIKSMEAKMDQIEKLIRIQNNDTNKNTRD